MFFWLKVLKFKVRIICHFGLENCQKELIESVFYGCDKLRKLSALVIYVFERGTIFFNRGYTRGEPFSVKK